MLTWFLISSLCYVSTCYNFFRLKVRDHLKCAKEAIDAKKKAFTFQGRCEEHANCAIRTQRLLDHNLTPFFPNPSLASCDLLSLVFFCCSFSFTLCITAKHVNQTLDAALSLSRHWSPFWVAFIVALMCDHASSDIFCCNGLPVRSPFLRVVPAHLEHYNARCTYTRIGSKWKSGGTRPRRLQCFTW